MNRKLLAAALLLLMPLSSSLVSAGPTAHYAYLFAKAGASAEFIAAYELLALGVAWALGPPGLLAYAIVNIG